MGAIDQVMGNLGIKAGVMSIFVTTMAGFLIVALVIAIIAGIVWHFRNKNILNKKCKILDYREDGSFKFVYGLKGGYVKNASGVRDFKLKIGKFPWQTKLLGYSPDPTKTNMEEEYIFIKVGDGSIYQQVQEILVTEKEIVDGEERINVKLICEPIPTDVKTATINQIAGVAAMHDKQKLTAYAITIIGFLIMAVVHAAFLYFTRKGAG